MTRRFAFAALAVMAGCKEDLIADLPDAGGVDAPEVATPEGDFRCVGTPYATTAPDPLLVRGFVHDPSGAMIGGATVEVRRADDDTLLFQDVTDNITPDRTGRYSSSVTSAGVAPRIYRKVAGTGDRLDTYTFDGFPVSASYELGSTVFSDSITSSFHTTLGIERDLTRGTVVFDVLDCGVPPAAPRKVAGVTVDAPPGARVFYGGPDGFIDQSLSATTTSGVVLVTNVAPGWVDLGVHAGPVTYRSWPVRVFANSWTTGVRHP
jgi:hypothetical protein